ncbi:MAG: cysteine desulfurase [Bacteroidetes bacterium]|nr:cysteine desulfurase [Bacteroidota bacterium]
MNKVYLDNAATTPIHPEVFEAMLPYLKENFGNPSSIHWAGNKVRVAIEETRELIADFINADASEIYFTSGGTESNNFIIRGIAKTEHAESGRKSIITSKIEHLAVLETIDNLASEGFEITKISPNHDGKVDPDNISEAIYQNTALISCMHINNEIGSINELAVIGNFILNKNIWLHTDAVQSFGKFPIDVNELGIHALTASAHKIYGPKGVGIAYVKSGTPLSPLILGGSQERNRRGGTENVAGIIGLGQAVRLAKRDSIGNLSHAIDLKQMFVDGINSIDANGLVLNGGKDSSPYIASVTFSSDYYKNDSEAMLIFLDLNGIAVSSGSACTSGTLKSSHVIKALGKSKKDAEGTIRFSFGSQNTIEEAEYTLEIIKKMAEKFRK